MSGELIQIEKPRYDTWNLLTLSNSTEIIALHPDVISKTDKPYIHWEKLKRKSWIPSNIKPEDFWMAVKLSRGTRRKKTPIKDYSQKDLSGSMKYSWVKCDHFEPVFHEIDLNMGGRMLGLKSVSERKRYKYVSRQLIEESIASAQLEGAHTTREAAQKMIREGRTPADLGQRMIYNNYRTMRLIEEELKDEPLTLEKLCELHDILTGGTLEKPDQAGRLRHEDEKITVSSEIDGKIAHIPPPVSFVKKEIKRLIAWANDELDEKNFIHPLIKAIALHFWIGYLHPFTDGNGRLARALFYWYMLRKGYWAFAFIPVSTRIKKSPKQYIEAYVYSEQDDCDLTYFIDYNIRQLELARKDFEEYLLNRESEGEKHKKLAKSMPELNDRQLQLMQYFLTHPNERTNVTSITRLYGVTPATAVKDLKTLEQKKLLTKKKQGRNMFYYSTGKLLGLSS